MDKFKDKDVKVTLMGKNEGASPTDGSMDAPEEGSNAKVNAHTNSSVEWENEAVHACSSRGERQRLRGQISFWPNFWHPGARAGGACHD